MGILPAAHGSYILKATTTLPAVAQDHVHLSGIVGKIPLSPWNPATLMRGGGIALDPWYDMDTECRGGEGERAGDCCPPPYAYQQWREALNAWAMRRQ